MAENKGGWMQAAVPFLTTGANAIASHIGIKRQYKYNKRLAEHQNELNRANAEWAFGKELELRKSQQDYDSPAAQMQRYIDAGLNPNLMYGQGTPGNMGSPGGFPDVKGVSLGQIDARMPALGSDFQQARLMAAQTDLTRQRTDESSYKSELIKAQKDVVRANPYLQAGYVDSVVSQMKATADLKKQEASFKLEEVMGRIGDKTDVYKPTERGYLIMSEQMDQLFTKHGIDRQKSANLDEDKKIKAEVFKSKEFQNDLQEIQRNWMRDGDITPQHIYQAIFMLLQTMMR